MSVGHDGRGVGGGPAVVAGAGLVSGAGRTAEGYCHRQLLDAVRYLVAGGISLRAMPADFPGWGRFYALLRRWREHGLIAEFRRKRHIVTDALGLLLVVTVTAAKIGDRNAAAIP